MVVQSHMPAPRFRPVLELLESRLLLSTGPWASFYVDPSLAAATGLTEPILVLQESGADRAVAENAAGAASLVDEVVWFDFDADDGLDVGAAADVEIIGSSPEGLTGRITVPGAWLEPVKLGGTKFTRLNVPGYGWTDAIGAPQLPVIRQLLAVPDGAALTAEILGQPELISMAELGIDRPLAPLQAPVEKLPGALEAAGLSLDQVAYATDSFAPETNVRLVEAGYADGQRLVMLEVAPIAYNPAGGAIGVYETLTFHVGIAGPEGTSAGDIAPFEAPGPEAMTGGRLLVITHNDFAGNLGEYVTHKTSEGWTVDVADTSTAGTTNTAIRSYIQGRYNNPATRPAAVLLVGDTDRIPYFVGSGSASPVTDLYYGCMDPGDDWYPEIPVGRFSVANSTQLGDVIEKTIYYETSSAGDWTNDAVFMASRDNYTVTEGTHNWVISNYMDPLGYDSTKLYQVTYGATTADVRNAFNAGQAMGVYSGHGSTYSWADGPPFSQSNVRGLTNAGKYPLISSFACITGQYHVAECFMETWLRSADKAAVVAVGASVSSYWTEDDILEKRLFDAIFDEGFTNLGSAWVRAKELYLDHFGVSSMTRMYFEMYNVLGDPTVEVLGLDFGIRSPADLPMAFVDQPYEYALQASSGVEPYTWALLEGSLPDGLSLNPTAGLISGTPTTAGPSTFVIQATDAAMATDSREFHLPVVSELRITTPSDLPPAFLGYPYSESLEATGGATPYAWSVLGSGQYSETEVEPGYIGGGAAQAWHDDDNYWQLTLPWEFNFYGTEYSSVYVCSNGFLNFGSGSWDWSNSQSGLLGAVRIAPLWDDLTTYSPDDIYVAQTADYVAIRWDAARYSGSTPVDFEAVLYRDGDILFNYGAAHSSLSPTIGISAGDNTNYTMASLDGANSIPANTSLLFSYGGQLPEGLAFNEATGQLSGTPTEMGVFDITFQVQDSGVPQQTVTDDFTLQVLDLPPLTVDVPAEAYEFNGLLTGTVSIPAAQASNVTVTLESDDTSEASLPSPTVVILAGQTSANFGLQVVDDTILDGTQSATITASAAGFYGDSDRIAVHDNERAVLTVTVPAEATEGDGVLPGRGTVTASAAVESDVVVALSSTDPTEATVPATVTIPEGSTSASFDVTIVDDAEIDGDRTATITAHVVNWIDGSDAIVVHDNDGAITVQVPEKVWEGQGTLAGAGTILLDGTLPADLPVSLLSDDTTELRVPATVVVPAGATSATFDLLVQDDGDYDGSQLVHISTTAPGLAGGIGTLHVGDDDVHHFGIDPIASPQTAGVPFSVTIVAKDVNDETIEVYDGSVDLTGAGDGGPVTIEIDPGSRAAPDSGVGANVKVFQPEDEPIGDGAKLDLGVYHDYAALTIALQEYAAAHPAISQLVSLGQSVQGRELWAMKITDNPAVEEDEPEVKYVSTMHGDEPVGTEMCLYLIDELLNDYATDPRITEFVDETEIWIVPLMNPDGREAGTRGNAHGVDLNRNFPDGAVSPIGNIFDGPPMDTAGRQVETVCVMEWSAEQSFSLSANFHTGALVVNYPYDNDGLGSVFSPSPDEDLFVHVSELYSVHNAPMWNSPTFFHGITNGAAWYSITGGMQDWHYRYLSCNEVTIELSDIFWPAESTLPGYWADNGESMLSYFEAVHMGARGLVTDAVTGAPVYAAVSVEGNEHRVYTDPDVGDYHRMLLPGTYSLTFSAPGYASRTIAGVEVADGATTRLDVRLVPAGAGIVFVDGEWTGEVAVQGVDTNVVLNVQDGHGHTGSSNAFDVIAGAVDHFEWSTISSPQYVDIPVPVTLTAVDANGFTATGFAGDVDLAGYVGTGTTSTLVISEVDTDESDAIEFTNVSGGPLDVSGWQVTIYDWNSWPSPQLAFTIPAGTVCSPDAVFLLQEEGSSPGSYPRFYAGGNFYWNNQLSGNPVAAVLRDASGSIADVMCAVDGDPGSITNPTPIPADEWQGDPVPGNSNAMVTYERVGEEDHNDSSDWVAMDRSLGSINDDLTVPFTGGRTPVPITPTTATFVGGVWTGDVTILEGAVEMYLLAEDGSGHDGESNLFEVEALPPLTVDVPGGATEGAGTVSGTVSIPRAIAADLVVTLETDETTEVSLLGAGEGSRTPGPGIMGRPVSESGLNGGGRAARLAESASLRLGIRAAAPEGAHSQRMQPSGKAPSAVVVIPAGDTSVTFGLEIVDDAILDASQAATITASATGYHDGSGQILVHDNEHATLFVSVPETAFEGDGVLAGQGRVTVSEAPGDDVVVSLSSDDTTEATVPATVTIPAGQTSATFDVTITDDAEVDGAQTATITAHVENWTGGTDAIDVQDNDGFISVELPARVWEGQGTLPGTGTVVLDVPLPADVEVSLASDDASELLVPDIVTVPAGQTSVTFDLFVQDDAEFDGSQVVHVSATAPGLEGGSGATEVGDDDLHHYGIDPIGSPQVAGVAFPVTVRAQDIHDETILVYAGGACGLSGSGDGGAVRVAPELTGVFVSGVWAGGVTVLAVDTNVVLTVEDTGGRSGESNPFDVVSGPLDHFEFSTVSSPQSTNNPFEVTIAALDANGYAVTDFSGGVALGGWVGAGTASTIVISELEEDVDAVEFTNVSGRDVDISGWQMVIYDNDNWPGPKFTVTVPGGTVCPAGDVFVVRENGPAPGSYPDFWTGGNINWGSYTAAMLLDEAGQLVDFMCAHSGVASQITDPMPIPPEHWTGPQVPFESLNVTYQRIGDQDHNDNTDWLSAPDNIGTVNPDLTVPFGGGRVPVPISPTSVTFVNGVWRGNVTVGEEAADMYLEADDGSGHVCVSNVFTVGPASRIPRSVALRSEYDTGVPGDNVTYLNNSGPLRSLQFYVVGTIAGSRVAVYADGVLIGTGTAPAFPVTVVTTDAVTVLADGVHTITARQTEPGMSESGDSPGVEITIDAQAPRVSAFGLSSTDSRWVLGMVDSAVWTDGRSQRTAPWAVIDRLVMEFDEPVLAAADDLTVTGGAPVLTGPSGSGTGTLTWDAAMYFPLGRYQLVLDGGAGGVRDIAGNALDGDGEPDVFPSGDGAPGGDWTFELDVLIGDVGPGDGVVDLLDRQYVRDRYGGVLGWGNYDPLADVNGDGVVNVIDRALVRFHYGDVLPPPAPKPAAADTLAVLPSAAATQTSLDVPTTRIPEGIEAEVRSVAEGVSPAPHVDVLSLCRGQLLPRRLRSLLAR